jgi:hypothetical protein
VGSIGCQGGRIGTSFLYWPAKAKERTFPTYENTVVPGWHELAAKATSNRCPHGWEKAAL